MREIIVVIHNCCENREHGCHILSRGLALCHCGHINVSLARKTAVGQNRPLITWLSGRLYAASLLIHKTGDTSLTPLTCWPILGFTQD